MGKSEKKRFSFGKLGKVEKALYARDEETSADQENREFVKSSDAPDVPSSWEIPEHLPDEPPKKHLISPSMMKAIFWSAAGFFVVAVGFAGFVFFGGLNRVSTENVVITIDGPSTIGAGEPLSFNISLRNDNNVTLEGVRLLVDYPEGTRTVGETEEDLPRELEEIGDIKEGESVQRVKRAALFGEADSTQHIIVSVEYRVRDSSATYFKQQYYDVLISTAPVRMTINTVSEAVSGNEVEFSVEVVSNSTTVVSGLMMRINYPFGFQFSTASPSPVYGNDTFLLGDLQPADRRVIRLRGIVTGQEGDERLFKFNLGLPDKRDTRKLGTVFLSSLQSIAIKRPFVSASLAFDGSSADVYAVPPGQSVRGEIAWTNNLDSRIADLEIKVKLSGEPLNRLSVEADGTGFYRSVDNVLLWDKTTSQQYAVVEPGEGGVASFSFASLPLSSLLYTGLRGNEISIDVSVNARRLSGASIPEQIVTGVSKKVRISSGLALSGRSLYFSGPFQNQGPIPPRADQNTTYTIVWSVTNTLNSVTGVRVSSSLPGYVTWLNRTSPAGEIITYDPASRQILWDIGDLPAGTGFSSSPREVSFQVSIVPSLSQLGGEPILVYEAVANGVDRFSNAQLKAVTKVITTKIEDAPAGMLNSSKVVQ